MKEYSLRKKLFFASAIVVLYFIFVLSFYNTFGNDIAVFSLIASISVSWIVGYKLSFLFTFLFCIASYVPLYVFNKGWGFYPQIGGFVGLFSFIVVNGIVGYFKEVKSKLTIELQAKNRAEKELLETQDKLRAKTEEVIHFTRAVSHDLKNPVTGLEGLFSILKVDEYYDMFDPEMQDVLDSAYHSVDYMKNLLNDLSEVAQLESKVKKLKFEKINLKDLVDNVLIGMKIQVDNVGIEIDTEHANINILGDRYGFTQIVANLAGNAIKYCGNGVEKPELKISGRFGKDKLYINFEDNGPGIPEDQAVTIFDKFRRGKNTKKTEGSGLGLFLVKSMVEAHEGEISVTTNNGRGANFTITLPAKLIAS